MELEEALEQLYEKARRDPQLLSELLLSASEEMPLSRFCAIARAAGCPMYEMDLLSAGEDAYAAMRRSTNGGGENSPALAAEEDYHELFLARLAQLRPFEGFVGVFDSGAGGISVLREMTELLPGERFLYFGDSACAPYGSRDADWIRKRAVGITKMLLDLGVKAVAIACNTATAAAVQTIRGIWPDVPVIGVEPALNVAVRMHEGSRFLVMATEVTLGLEKYNALSHRLEREAEFYPLACRGLAAEIEKGDAALESRGTLLRELRLPYRGRVDGVVLGCTHYPLIRGEIREVLGDLPLYDGGEGTARELARRLAESGLAAQDGEEAPAPVFLSSRPTKEQFAIYDRFYAQAGEYIKARTSGQ